jgi:hypothetical protein
MNATLVRAISPVSAMLFSRSCCGIHGNKFSQVSRFVNFQRFLPLRGVGTPGAGPSGNTVFKEAPGSSFLNWARELSGTDTTMILFPDRISASVSPLTSRKPANRLSGICAGAVLSITAAFVLLLLIQT